ncbi:MAG: biotin/lipoate A/B protein ligase family protein [Hyphomicrobiaceae bacterium]
MEKRDFRVIDTGVRDGRRQIALDQAMVELHAAGQVPDTVRFLRFPPTVLIGRHQALGREVKRDYCAANGIGLVRRITGGGAIYLDEGQLGWELVLSRARLPLGSLADYTRAICEAVAAGLSEGFGIEARFRPRNDIEVGGRKLCGTGGFFDGDTLIYQGTVLIDMDPARMVAALNVPEAKLRKRALDDAGQRVVTLKELLGGAAPDVNAVSQAVLSGLASRLGIVPRPGQLTAVEQALADQLHDEEIGLDSFVAEIDEPGGGDVLEASASGPGGTMTCYLRLEGEGGARRVREALLTGDFFVTPPRIVYDLEAALRGVPVGEVGAAVERFLAAAEIGMVTLTPTDIRDVIVAAATSEVRG